MERRGPDSLEGWFIALVCCLISTLMYGAVGMSSMLFVASVTRYDTDRNKASFPYVLSTVFQAVTGPFAGYFAKKFNARIVVLVGSILGFLGIGTCFFAEDITTVTVLWGVVYGTGFGLSSLLLPVIINEYFFKQRSIALGMCYLGSPIGFFIFPPIFEVLYNTYGLSGTFLIISGINMHCIPLSMLLKQPDFKVECENSPLKYGEKHDSYLSTDLRTPDQTFNLNLEIKNGRGKNGEIPSCARRNSIEFLWKQSVSTEQLIADDKKYELSLNKSSLNDNKNFIFRSFKKTSRNHYESPRNGDHTRLQNILNKAGHKNGTCSYDTQSRLDQNDQYSNRVKANNNTQHCHVYEQQSLKDPEIAAELKFNIRNTEGNKLNFSNKHEEVSTIYFGTDKSSCISENNEHHVKSVPNQNNSCKTEETVWTSYSQVKFDGIHDATSNGFKDPILLKYRKVQESFNSARGNIYDEEVSSVTPDIEKTSTLQNNSMLKMYLNPVFILMCIINAIVNLHFTTLTTVIIDFSRDHKIDSDYEKFIMMCVSLTGAFGMLGFGWITDGGYLSRTRFGALTQLIASVSTTVLPFTAGFETLMVPLAIWCTCQSSFIPLIPAITAEYFSEDMQAVAVSACNVLSGPLYLIIPPLIGYFRDEKGSYDNILFLLGVLSFLNCIAVFTIPYLARWRSKKETYNQNVS